MQKYEDGIDGKLIKRSVLAAVSRAIKARMEWLETGQGAVFDENPSGPHGGGASEVID